MIISLLLTLAASPAPQQAHAQHRPAPKPVAAQPEHASKADEAAVIAAIDRMLAALSAKDGAALIAATWPEGRGTGTGKRADGTPFVSSRAWPQFAEGLTQIPGKPVERNIGPHVHVDGDIAMVWTPYVFTIDGKLSHCGINHFDLVRRDREWRVLNVTWTQRTTGCPAA